MKSKQISSAQAQELLLLKRPHINPRLVDRPAVKEFEAKFVS